MKFTTKKLTVMAMLAAFSVVLALLIHFPLFPAMSFLEYDPADIPIFIGTFAMGPMAGLILTVVASVIQGLTVSAHSGLYGIVMHILATGTFVLIAGNIYKRGKTLKRAVISLICGTLGWVIVMAGANLVITPWAIGQPLKFVLPYMLPVIIPFNIIKAGANSIITFAVYKVIGKLIKKLMGDE